MGGELEIVARFPDYAFKIKNFCLKLTLKSTAASIFTPHYDEEIFGLLILILCCFMSV
jgi:hypothetical protein